MAEEEDDYEINDFDEVEEDDSSLMEDNNLDILSYDEIVEKNKNTKKQYHF